MAHSYRLRLVTWGYQIRVPVGTDICHCGCAYTVLQSVQMNGVYSADYGTVHYKEPMKSFKIRVGHSPGFGFSSVAMVVVVVVIVLVLVVVLGVVIVVVAVLSDVYFPTQFCIS